MDDPYIAMKAAIDQYNTTHRDQIAPFLAALDAEMKRQGIRPYVRDRILVNTHRRLFLQEPVGDGE